MVFFFYGANTYASRRKLQQMITTYVKKSGSDFGLERFEGSSLDAATLSAALTASPFLANSRLVVVYGLSANKSVATAAIKLAERVPESTVAVFYETEVDQRSSYFKQINKIARAFKFDQLTPHQLSAWIKQEVEHQGGRIDRPAINMLLDYVGDDQWRLAQEINKLVNFDTDVSTKSIKMLVTPSQSQSIFELVDAVVSGNTGRALAVYHKLLAARTNEIYILTMIIWQLRNLLLAKTAGPVSPADLAREAGMSSFVASKMIAKQRDFDEGALRQAFLKAIETDNATKTGQGDPAQLVEALIYHIATSVAA